MGRLGVVVLLLVHQTVAYPPALAVTKASNFFAHKLYSNITHRNDDNVLICPLSLHVTLSLLHQGAGGNTAAELATVLGISDFKEETKKGYHAKLITLKEQDDKIRIATKLFPSADCEIKRDYLSLVRKYFLSDLENVDYSFPEEVIDQMNKYVEDKTNHHIQDLVSDEDISELTRMIVIDAVYFQAPWKTKFSRPYDGDFLQSANKIYRTKMMTQIDYFDYKEDIDLGAQVLKIDFGVGNYSMFFILPKDMEGLHALSSKLINRDLESLLKDMQSTLVEVTIPKFKLEQKHDLKRILYKMGIKHLFHEGRADLHGIVKRCQLYVSDIIHKTFIEIPDAGTESATATDREFANNIDQPVKFRVDHPFFFGVLHSQDTVLFYGRLMHPVSYDLPVPERRLEDVVLDPDDSEDKPPVWWPQ